MRSPAQGRPRARRECVLSPEDGFGQGVTASPARGWHRERSLFIEGLKPISEKTQELVKSKFNGKKVHIGMSPALVIGMPRG